MRSADDCESHSLTLTQVKSPSLFLVRASGDYLWMKVMELLGKMGVLVLSDTRFVKCAIPLLDSEAS